MSSFRTLFDLLGEISRKRYAAGEKFYARYGLNHTEGRILRLVQEAQGSMSQDDLGLRISVDRTNVGRALAKLEDVGYVDRQPDENDKRAKVVTITAKGMAVVQVIDADRAGMLEDFFGELTEEEAEAAVQILNKVVRTR